MKNKLIFIVLFNVLFSFFGVTQTTTTVSESRKENLKSVLNYRYKGGFYTLEKHFNASVSYPQSAMLNCRLGICIASVTVDCDGIVSKVTLKNPLKLGIDEEISNFFNSTSGNWNTCTDEKYTRFDIPIQFTLAGTETNSTDALLIVVGEGIPGQPCFSDEYYLKKLDKYMEKENGKKALPVLDILIRRDPFNNDLYEMKKLAMSYL